MENRSESARPLWQRPGLIVLRRFVVIMIWGALMLVGFGRLIEYEGKPGSMPAAARRNTDFPTTNQMALVIAIHPHCPCTRASVAELLKVYSHAEGKFSLTALVFKPNDESDEWVQSPTFKTIQRLHPRIVIDVDGKQAEKLGLTTSGQVMLYDEQGDLRYNGGITGARGHAGDNAGESAVIAILNGKGSDKNSTAPVFGCSIFDKKS